LHENENAPWSRGYSVRMAGSAESPSRWAVVRNALSNPNLVKVEVGTAIGVLGHAAYSVALQVFIIQRFGVVGIGDFLMVRLLGGALGVPVYSALAGRFRRERVLAGGFLANAVAVALVIPVLQLHSASWLLFLPVAIEGFTHSAPRAIHDALLPWLADSPAQLVASNAFSATIDTLAALVGGLLASLILWLAGPSGPSAALVIVVILGVLAAFPLFAIRGIDTRGGVERSSLLKQYAAGFGVLRRLPNGRAVVLVMMLVGVIAGFEHSNLPSIVTQIMHLPALWLGVMTAFAAAGGFIGGIASLSVGRRSLSVSLATGLLIVALGLFALTVTPKAEFVAPLLLGVISIGMLYQGVSSRTLLQSTASGRSLDLLVGVNTLIAIAVSAVSARGAAQLNATFGVRTTLQIAAGLAIIGVIYSRWRLTKVEKQAPTNQQEVEAIKQVEAFGPLSIAAANQLADALTDAEAAEGEVVVRQGEPGDDMFLIKSGVFDATVDGEQVRTMQHGDHFGEIALLFNAPRTATVQCVQAGSLLRLRREDFLRAVTGNATSEEAMRAIADNRLAHAGHIESPSGD
jgi:predicted MFS family arabinose efflux permease